MPLDNRMSPTRSHRAGGLTVSVLAAVLAGAVLVPTVFLMGILRSPEIDQSRYDEWVDGLKPGIEDVDSLPMPAGMRADPTALGDCATDDLEIFQPTVTKTWTTEHGAVTEVRNALTELKTALRQKGWRDVDDDRINGLTLRTARGRTLTISFVTSHHSVEAVIYGDGPRARICSRNWLPFLPW